MDLRRDRRPTSKVQAEMEDLSERRAAQQAKIAKAAKIAKKKAQRRQDQENIAPDTGPLPPPAVDPAKIKPRGGSQKEPSRGVLVRRDLVVPPGQKSRKLTAEKARQILNYRSLREGEAGNAGPRPAHPQADPPHAQRPAHPQADPPHAQRPALRQETDLFNNGRDDDDDDDDDEVVEEVEAQYGSGQGDYRGMPGYPNWTPPRYPTPVNYDPEDQDTTDNLPQTGSKRARANSIEPGRKAQRTEATDGRPKAKDLDIEEQEVLASSIKHYRALLSSENPYPEPLMEANWAKAAWREGCKINEVSIDHDSTILKLITARGSHLRGEVKTHAKAAVRGLYKFRCTTHPTVLEKQKKQVEQLKVDFAYAYQKPGFDGSVKSGFLKSRAIQDVVNNVWFRASKTQKSVADGVALKDIYKQFPIVAIALVLSGIVCALDEWTSGTRVKVNFYASAYQSVFDAQLKMLKNFEQDTREHEILKIIGAAIYKEGCAHANAEDVDQADGHAGLSEDAVKAAIAEYQGGVDQGDDEYDSN